MRSNKILASLLEIVKKNGIDQNALQLIESKNRKVVDFLLSKMSNYIDVIVPRGGKGLVQKFKNLQTCT